MSTPRGTATTPQEQDTNRSHQSPQPPPGWPDNGQKDEPPFVSQSESEHNSRRDNETGHESKPDGEDASYWPCMCEDGYNTAGEWIRCEKSNCRLKRYHLACVGLSKPPAEKWICRQCRARTRKVAVAKPDPKKKGIAIKVTPKKGQGRRKSWRELPSDKGEEYKRKVDSSREVEILPGKTRSSAGQEAVYSEDESESTENEKTPQQKTRKGGHNQIDTTSEDTNTLGNDADSHVSTPGKNFYADYPEHTADIRALGDVEDDLGHAEDSGTPTNVKSPPTPAPGYDLSSESSEDEWDGNADATNEVADAQKGTIEDGLASPVEDDAQSKDRENVTEVDDTASDMVESSLESDLVSNNRPVRSSRPTTPEAASTLLSIASTTTGETHRPRTSGPVTLTEGDQALVSALRGSWVGQYFA